MFGDNNMTGKNKVVHLGSGNKISMPNFTNSFEDDTLYVMYGPNDKCLILVEKEKFLEEVEQLRNVLHMYKNINNSHISKLFSQIRSIRESGFLGEVKVSSDRKIVLPKEATTKLKLKNSIYAVGNENQLELYKSEESYENSKVKRFVKKRV